MFLRPLFRLVGLAFAATMAVAMSATASAAPSDVQTTWQMLNYMSVDYSGAVANGKIISQSEYGEMREFAGSVRQQIAGLPPSAAKADLVAKADQFVGAVDRKESPAKIRSLADTLGDGLLKAYPVALAPGHAPDLARGAKLFNATCASCHGAARSAADRLRRPRAGRSAEPVRALPGDRPRHPRNGDGQLLEPAGAGPLGPRLLRQPVRLSRFPCVRGQAHLGLGCTGSQRYSGPRGAELAD